MISFRSKAKRLIDRIVRGSIFRCIKDRKGPVLPALIDFLHQEHIYERLDRLEQNKLLIESDYIHDINLRDKARNLLRLISPRDPINKYFCRFGRDNDGGYIMIDNIIESHGIAYSFGISDDVSWDYDLAERGYTIFQYDHTIDRLPKNHPNFHFSKIGLCGIGEDGNEMLSIENIIDINGHRNKNNMILKIDIEGDEWKVFSTISPEILKMFDQIVVEYHWFDRIYDDKLYQTMYKALKNISNLFTPVHVHGNNHYDIKIIGGVPVPQLVEVTYVRSEILKTDKCDRLFPTEIDQPNKPDRPDLYLGSFQF